MSVYLISGASGFIGRRLLNKLQSIHRVIPISRSPISGLDTVIHDFEVDDISSINLEGVDVIFHLAGFVHDLRDASKVEFLYHALNVDATVQMIKLAVTSDVKRFVFVSSVKAGGCGLDNNPEGVYGQTKREAELKILEIGRQSGMHVSIVRSSLVYGAGMKGNLALMRRGIQKGWFPPLPKIANRRSMIHVDDLVRVLLLVAQEESANGEIFIATDGVPHSSRDIYEAMCKSVGKEVPSWSVPKFLFDLVSFVSSRFRYKVDKLLGDEYYSSEKIERLGFRAEKSLMDLND
ncbi:NAD-dependent epimerase/dehydratase family protein [Deltaproteobacteria bacterium]|nr:NAD-dependent epimerase/dehydratase family protein [Deltaproteobacteria bacterium]